MLNRRPAPTKIPVKFVILGVIMIIGVLSMAYGYYQNNRMVLYIGLGITFLTAVNTLVFSAFHPSEPHQR